MSEPKYLRVTVRLHNGDEYHGVLVPMVASMAGKGVLEILLNNHTEVEYIPATDVVSVVVC